MPKVDAIGTVLSLMLTRWKDGDPKRTAIEQPRNPTKAKNMERNTTT